MTLAEIKPDMELTWLNVPRGGYGFAMAVDATVIKVCARRVRIRVSRTDGTLVERFVTPITLQPRTGKGIVCRACGTPASRVTAVEIGAGQSWCIACRAELTV